jgi:ubiquinone/menaquinone biosynthesis C-methylase UbiE
MDDPAEVRSQYLTEENLETRRSVWHPTAEGRDPTTEALDAVVAENPLRVLEVGPGTGGFAARVAAALPGVRLTAIDQSARFVELTRARGIDAREGDVQDLPFGDEAFDVVIALWMLYHVSDVDRAIAEVRRVLRPGGLFVAVTNGDGHLADLRIESGGTPLVSRFSSQNGEKQLSAHFGDVRRTDLRPRAVFADSTVAEAYLRSSGEDVDWQVPTFDEPREYAGEATIFCCR